MNYVCVDCKKIVASCYSCESCRKDVCKDCKLDNQFLLCQRCDLFFSYDEDIIYGKGLRQAHCDECGLSWDGFAQCLCEGHHRQKEEEEQEEEKDDDGKEEDYNVAD
jgi:hypothetical protein